MNQYQSVSTIDDDINIKSSVTGWDSLRKEARSLEQAVDARLITYSQQSTGGSASASAAVQGEEISSLLKKLEFAVEEMKKCVGADSSHQHLYSRHVANLYEYGREFTRVKVGLLSV